MSSLGEKLRNYRKTRAPNVGLKKLAPQLGVDYTYLSKIENDLAIPSLILMEKIANFYHLSSQEKIELFELTGRSGVINVSDDIGGNKETGKIHIENNSQQQTGMQVKIDPIRTPVLYADSIHIKADNNGFVLDIAQQVGPTKEYTIVARIGMSKDHAKSLGNKLQELITKREGKSETGKVKLVN